MEDTIAAISTALGVGAISIIRVSGKNAIEIVNNIFKGEDLIKKDSHTITYGHIISDNNIIDEVLVSIMKGPKSFTAEDVVEINCHGGIATTNKILELLLINGCRLAEPGEFTKRAFLNGRIDLLEAESVMDIINSKTDKARDLAIHQLSGTTSNLISALRDKMSMIISNIEVNIDYPEYDDVDVLTTQKIKPQLNEIINEVKHIILKSENNKMIKDGIDVLILGRPNVGKSSLLNCLLEEEKAIVTDIEGTTRDIVEGKINLDGIILNVIDTAGIRQTNDIVEKIGVEKSLSLINKADLVLFMLDNGREITEEDKEIIDKIKTKNHIIIINKCDLASKIAKDKLNNVVEISAKEGKGIDKLKSEIKKLFNLENIETDDFSYLSSARSIALLKKALESLESADDGINNNSPIDMVEIDIKESWNLLGQIIGETYEDELVDKMFSNFCLGK